MKSNKLSMLAGLVGIGLSLTVQAAPYGSLVICRGQQCADARYTMTREYLFNQMKDLFEKNIGKQVLLCEADPVSHRCYNPAVRVKATSNMVKTDISIPSAEILDTKVVKGATELTAIMDFVVDANGTRPRCESAQTRVLVPTVDDVTLSMTGFNCAFTATGNSQLNMNYAVDYVDFDYGTMGAYYTIGSGEVVRGGKTGYVILRFTEKMPGTTYELGGLKPVETVKTEIKSVTTPAGESVSETLTVQENAAKETIKDITVVQNPESVDSAIQKQSGSSNVCNLKTGCDKGDQIQMEKTVKTTVTQTNADGQTTATSSTTVTAESVPAETFSEKWDRWTDNAVKVFYLE